MNTILGHSSIICAYPLLLTSIQNAHILGTSMRLLPETKKIKAVYHLEDNVLHLSNILWSVLNPMAATATMHLYSFTYIIWLSLFLQVGKDKSNLRIALSNFFWGGHFSIPFVYILLFAFFIIKIRKDCLIKFVYLCWSCFFFFFQTACRRDSFSLETTITVYFLSSCFKKLFLELFALQWNLGSWI